MSKAVTSLQIKVHECHVKQLKPRESLLTIDEASDEEQNEQSEIQEDNESDTEKDEQIEDDIIENGVILGFIFNTNIVLKINQILKT